MSDLTPQNLKATLNAHILVDVRSLHEFIGPLGHIESAILVPLGQDLIKFLETADPTQSYVFICRSGHRSGLACELATTYGFSKTFNLIGGMIRWRETYHKKYLDNRQKC